MCILGYTGDQTHWAYCPPDAPYGTIDSYPWVCPKTASGDYRESAPYFSNANVIYKGFATGNAENDNAAYMTEERFHFRDAGTNCLDGKPDEKWMNFDADGTIGNDSYLINTAR